MELTPENLSQMERQSLISLADQLGVKFGGNSSNETIAKKILESQQAAGVVAEVNLAAREAETGFTALKPEHDYVDDSWVAAPQPVVSAPTQPMYHTAQAPASPVVNNTQAEVQSMLDKLFTRLESQRPNFERDQFKFDYSREENTWQFSYKGCVESGNMAIPLRVIQMKAETVSVGARRLRSFGNDGQYKGYAGQILG